MLSQARELAAVGKEEGKVQNGGNEWQRHKTLTTATALFGERCARVTRRGCPMLGERPTHGPSSSDDPNLRSHRYCSALSVLP